MNVCLHEVEETLSKKEPFKSCRIFHQVSKIKGGFFFQRFFSKISFKGLCMRNQLARKRDWTIFGLLTGKVGIVRE